MLQEDSARDLQHSTPKQYLEGQNVHGIGAWVLDKLGMKFSDYAILCFIVIVGSFLFTLRDHVSFYPAFFQPIDSKIYLNKLYPMPWERGPKPIVTDLENDGENEIILSFPDGTVTTNKFVLTSSKSNNEYLLPNLKQIYQYSLSEKDGTQRHAINIDVGFLEQDQNIMKERKRLVAVLTNDSNVFLLNSDLSLVWSQKVGVSEDGIDDLYFTESALLVNPTGIEQGDKGCIFAGGTLEKREDIGSKIERESVRRSEEISHKLHHFSLYALDGRTGAIRWKHEAGDFEEIPEMEFPKNFDHYKFKAWKGSRHRGEKKWSHYKNSMRQQLPYSWSSLYDTKLTLEQLRGAREEISRSQYKQKPVIGLDSKILSRISGKYSNWITTDNNKELNSIFAFSQNQIQIIDMFTGRPLSTFTLDSKDITVGDISGDGQIEELRAELQESPLNVETDPDQSKWITTKRSLDTCRGIANTLTDSTRRLAWEGELCTHPHGIDNLASSFVSKLTMSVIDALYIAGLAPDGKKGMKKIRELKLQIWGESDLLDMGTLDNLAPIMVPSASSYNSPLQLHFTRALTDEFHLGGATSYDSIFILSNGRVTSFSPTGHFNWQIYIAASWEAAVSYRKSPDKGKQGGIVGFEGQAFIPHANALNIQSSQDAAVTHLFVAGLNYISLIALADGRIESENDLPCSPVVPSVIADFDLDGVNDVIVTCSDKFIGFRIKHSSGQHLTKLITLLVTGLVVVVLMHFRSSEGQKSETKQRKTKKTDQLKN